MEQKLWLSRNKDIDGYYNLHEDEPIREGSKMYYGFIDTYCPEIFHRLVEGARLRKGRKKRIKRILIELED